MQAATEEMVEVVENLEEYDARMAAIRAKRDARKALDAATARMERTANRVIEHVIRRGCVDRADAKALREHDAECRRLSKEIG